MGKNNALEIIPERAARSVKPKDNKAVQKFQFLNRTARFTTRVFPMETTKM
jgi:hypothetical protein